MKIVLNQAKKMRRDEMILILHPKNVKLGKSIKNLLESKLGEIEVKDDYNNRFIIPLLSIYYFEMIDQKIFVYTQDEVYRVYKTMRELKEFCKHAGFFQINVRTLVNERHVIQYTKTKGCHRQIILDNHEVLIANRSFKEEVDKVIGRRNCQI